MRHQESFIKELYFPPASCMGTCREPQHKQDSGGGINFVYFEGNKKPSAARVEGSDIS